jgi:Protein of unknown function (DUF2905)
MRELGRTLLICGVLMGAGALLFFGGKLPFRLGRLPGDIAVSGRNGTFYIPIITCLLLSLLLTLIFWLAAYFRR